MKLLLTNIIILIWAYFALSINYSDDVLNEKLMISLERPQIVMEQPQVLHVYNVTSRRLGRSDPRYYLHLCVHFLKPFNNSYTVNIVVKDNQFSLYSITYVEFHYELCDFIKLLKFDVYYKKNMTDELMPTEIKFKNNNYCTLVPGIYYFSNVVLPAVNFPKNFPLQKSRLHFNIKHQSQTVLRSHIDLELKPVLRRPRKN